MSGFGRGIVACHCRVTMGDGPLDVVRLWRMVNLGCNVAIRREPFWYLEGIGGVSSLPSRYDLKSIPNGKSAAVCGRS